VTSETCLTVDVEDFYDGMAVLGQPLARPAHLRSGLSDLLALLEPFSGATLTLFVVGNYAPTVAPELSELVGAGHEIASHGPDHGRLPEDRAALLDWVRRGKETVEERVGRPVRGFRSPRFDIPRGLGLAGFRDVLAEAGFSYVSDTHRLGDGSPIAELPVLTIHGFPIGGGSYQRLVPFAAVRAALDAGEGPSVLYYHSYDFGANLPPPRSVRSVALAKQVLGRGRIAKVFAQVIGRYGSKACGHVQR
jgi:hypothetical protein